MLSCKFTTQGKEKQITYWLLGEHPPPPPEATLPSSGASEPVLPTSSSQAANIAANGAANGGGTGSEPASANSVGVTGSAKHAVFDFASPTVLGGISTSAAKTPSKLTLNQNHKVNDLPGTPTSVNTPPALRHQVAPSTPPTVSVLMLSIIQEPLDYET